MMLYQVQKLWSFGTDVRITADMELLACRQGIGTVTPLFDDEYEDWRAWRKTCSISPVHCKHQCICVHVI
jgi:hypothetical protein